MFTCILISQFAFIVVCHLLEMSSSKIPENAVVLRKRYRYVNKSDVSQVTHIRLQSINLRPDALLALSTEPGTIGTSCNESFFVSKNIRFFSVQESSTAVAVKAVLPQGTMGYLCMLQPNDESNPKFHGLLSWFHVGSYKVIPLSPNSGADAVVSRSLPLKHVTADALISFNDDVVGAKIFGLRAEGDRVYISKDGFTQIPANMNITVRVFGVNFSIRTEFAFTSTRLPRGSRCDNNPIVRIVAVSSSNIVDENVVEIQLSLPLLTEAKDYFICVKETYEKGDVIRWIHQGDEPWLRLEPIGRLLPMWLQICLIICLLCLSGLFSGLNLGLMALDRLELQVIENCGTETERKYARIISPLRNRGNYLLCSLLLGNVLVNSTLTILLDDLTSGIIAIIGSTMSIVVIGEIIPQALCSRHGLSIGARTVWVTKFFMLATFPLSFPISKILDCMLGEEIGNVYDRERLMEYIRITKPYNKLENEEVNIISGALELRKKTVSNVMTKIDDVFMVPYHAVLNFETMSEIMKQGYSRIPVFDGDRNNVVALLNIKDLAFVDPDDNSPLRTLCEFYNHPINYVFEDETLDVMLNEFKKGQSHMAFVRHVNNEGDGDPFYEIIGVVTLEDVIEEILQSEIIDETDVLTDNRRKQRRKETQIKQDFSEFAKIGGGQQGSNCISPQLALATYQYLSTSVEPFKKSYLSETVLKRLMAQNVFFSVKQSSNVKNEFSSSVTLYETGIPADFFILVLEGRCHVTVGKEKLVFETGPFSYFGLPALAPSPNADLLSQHHMQPSHATVKNSTLSISMNSDNGMSRTFIPDYTVIAIAQTLYMKIHWTVYLAAYRATLMERQKYEPGIEDPYHSSWEQDFFPASCGDSTTVNISHNQTRKRPFNSPTISQPSGWFNGNGEQNVVRRASVEIGCIRYCQETADMIDSTLVNSPNSSLVKSPSFLASSDIPMIDMSNNLEVCLDSLNSENEEKLEVLKKRLGEGISVKKASPVNGSKESTTEYTRLLYPSEA